MNDPPRLLDQTNNPLISGLLSAAKQEQPRRRSLNGTLLAVAAAASVVGGHATAGAAAGSVAAASLVKLAATWTLLGVVVVGGGVAGVEASGLMAPSGARPQAPVSPPVIRPKAPTPLQSAPREPSGPQTERGLQQDAVQGVPPVSGVVSGRGLTPGQQEHLDQEVALLDRAWGALGRGQFDETRSISERYLAAYPHGRLEQEARYLKMQAARRLGNGVEAEAEAARLLELNPSGPHAKAAHEVRRERGE